MIVKILITLFLMFVVTPGFAVGPGVGPDCNISWGHPNPVNVNGYKVYFGTSPSVYGVPVDIGNVTATTCSALGIIVAGQQYITISGYNAIGEGGKAVETPFALQVVVPAAPTQPVVAP